MKSLRKLRTIPIEWINSYHQKTDEGKTLLRERTPFTILSELKIVEKEVDGTVNRAVGYFKPDDRILQNLLANFTKPLLLDVMINLKSDIGVLLYSHIDLMLARKDTYERRTKELFEDLGLINSEYSRQYERYRALKKAVAELQGVHLSTGTLRSAAIEKTIDRKDYKIVFKKAASPDPVLATGDDVTPEVVIHHYARPKDSSTAQAEELVTYFHHIVHGVNTHEPQSREMNQAVSLIGQYGPEKARHIVDYTKAKASETNFNIQHFGAVLSYASRAVAEFDRAVRTSATRTFEAAAPSVPTKANPVPSRGLSRLAALSPGQYQARFEAARAAVLHDIPFLARQTRRGSKLEEEMVRSRLVRDLDAEPMDLVPASWFPDWFRPIVPEMGTPKDRHL